MKYVLSGIPIPLKRPRFGQGHAYDSQKDEKSRAQYELMMQRRAYYEKVPLKLAVTFFMKKPKRPFKNRPIEHYTKPDLSNLIKYVEDVCISILYHDDCLIACIDAKKIYDDEPRTEFTLEPLP